MKNQPAPRIRPFVFNSEVDVADGGRRVPPKMSDFAQVECFRELTFWERIKIFCGFNLMIYVGMTTQHRPGYADVQIACFTTQHMTPDEHLRDGLKNHLKKNHPEAFK